MIFEGSKWDASDEEIKLLAQRMLELEKRGLSKLNRRLIEGGRNIWDTFAEHNFGYELIKHNPSTIPIFYEPNKFECKTLNRPPDFVIQKNGITFWIQMKKLSNTKRENRRSKDIAQIKRLAQSIKVNKFFWCSLSVDFNSYDVKPLVDFISTVAADSIEYKEYFYPSKEHIKAKVTFWKPKKSVFEHLTCGGVSDLGINDTGGRLTEDKRKDIEQYLNCSNVIGESREQIKKSLSNAAGAFDRDTDNKNINLIAMEMGNASHHYIDVGEAVFGDEVFTYGSNGRQGWHRANNGFFNDPRFCCKVAGVIVLKRKEHLPVTTYTTLLFINDQFKYMLNQINLIMEFDKVIYFNELINDDD